MKKLLQFWMFTMSLTIFSCENPIDDKQLLGNWTAAEFLENDVPKDVDLKSINFSFFENNTYTFQGLLNKEAGSFYLKGNLLYSTDTLSTNRIEKSVKVIKSTSDSLFFEMNNGGISQIIKLYKVD